VTAATVAAPAPGALLAAALAWAAHGVAVVPCHSVRPGPSGPECSCGDAACPSPGKHPLPPRGVHEATTDPATLRAWWARWPLASPAGCPGPDRWVLDLDGPVGARSWAGWCEAHGVAVPRTLTVRTGGGGRHLWWAVPPGGRAPRNRVGVLPGVDVRARGGYALLPPSPHASGRRYELEVDCAPVPAPAAVVDLVAPPPLPPPPPVHPRAWYPDGGLAVRLADPGERAAWAAAAGGTLSPDGSSARGVRCPRCGRPSVWWAIRPERWYGAACSHRSSCGWAGPLAALVTQP